MNRYDENETRWGAYNVLTGFATHQTRARQGSNVFSAGYKQIETVTDDFYHYYPSAEERNNDLKSLVETGMIPF